MTNNTWKYPARKAENRLRLDLLLIIGLATLATSMILAFLVMDTVSEINNVRVNACFVDGC